MRNCWKIKPVFEAVIITSSARAMDSRKSWLFSEQGIIASIATLAILAHLLLRSLRIPAETNLLPLYIAYVLGGIPIIYELIKKVLKRQFGSDLLAGIAIVTSIPQAEYLAGTFIILMLSGGEALEVYATERASAVLKALASRMPRVARIKRGDKFVEEDIERIVPGDSIELLPHDICPVDGEVISGRGHMDESFLTGEPFRMPKIAGSAVISGALNQESLLVIKALQYPAESRYQKIAKVIEEQAKSQVPLKRMADRLGAWYTPLALLIASLAWYFSGEASRFLSVLVTATPCPLLIAIPVSLIGSISTAASRGIIIKNPAILEVLPTCRTMVLDKTGTLTYGRPALTKIHSLGEYPEGELLGLLASLEEYSKHPLASAVRSAAKKQRCQLKSVSSVTERAGQGLTGIIDSSEYKVTNRKSLRGTTQLPPQEPGLECLLLKDGSPIAVFIFQDQPRKESYGFVTHARKKHGIQSIKILSGDKLLEVSSLASQVGIDAFEADLSPEDKLRRIKEETLRGPTVYIGDGINDAPALQAATVGIAMGSHSDITGEAADAVILDSSLEKTDELIHIATRMRRIAFQSAFGGMGVSLGGMVLASIGLVTPLGGAILQEVIDVFAVLNSLRTAYLSKDISPDFSVAEGMKA